MFYFFVNADFCVLDLLPDVGQQNAAVGVPYLVNVEPGSADTGTVLQGGVPAPTPQLVHAAEGTDEYSAGVDVGFRLHRVHRHTDIGSVHQEQYLLHNEPVAVQTGSEAVRTISLCHSLLRPALHSSVFLHPHSLCDQATDPSDASSQHPLPPDYQVPGVKEHC